MDELEISGKRYLSTKRAGKEHGYHSDYIGQLIRGKKVVGEKVGRAWYVEEGSLAKYLGKEIEVRSTLAKITSAAQQETSKPDVEGRVVEVQPQGREVIKEKIETPREAAVVESADSSVETNKEEGQPTAIRDNEEERKIPIHTHFTKTVEEKPTGLTYLPDDEPFLPIVTVMPVGEVNVIQRGAVEVTKSNFRLPRAVALGVLVGAAAMLGAAISTLLATTSVVEEGKTASVFYSIWIE